MSYNKSLCYRKISKFKLIVQLFPNSEHFRICKVLGKSSASKGREKNEFIWAVKI